MGHGTPCIPSTIQDTHTPDSYHSLTDHIPSIKHSINSLYIYNI